MNRNYYAETDFCLLPLWYEQISPFFLLPWTRWSRDGVSERVFGCYAGASSAGDDSCSMLRACAARPPMNFRTQQAVSLSFTFASKIYFAFLSSMRTILTVIDYNVQTHLDAHSNALKYTFSLITRNYTLQLSPYYVRY